MLRTVTATRYVTPLREGGSLPALVEGSDWGMYVLKFRGAGQGVKALIAEVVAGELGRALGLPVPELVLVEVDAALGRAEPDSEIRELLKASVGLNVALDYLPGSITFDPIAEEGPPEEVASSIVWFDALITNVDRTPKNPNLLCWHNGLWLIDHGASLYVHHSWDEPAERARSRFPAIKDHVLLPWAKGLEAAAARLGPRLTDEVIAAAVDAVPAAWLEGEPHFPDVEAHRAAYRDFLEGRRESSPLFVEEALRARAQLV